MDFDEIRQLAEEDGGKIFIVERNKVVAVVLSFEAYRSMKNTQAPSLSLHARPVSEPAKAFAERPAFAAKAHETETNDAREPFGFPKTRGAVDARTTETPFAEGSKQADFAGDPADSGEFFEDADEKELTIDDLPL